MIPGEPTPRGGDRLTARRRALELLHGADVGDTDPRDGLTGEDPYYARALVEGVVAHRAESDLPRGRDLRGAARRSRAPEGRPLSAPG